MESDMEGYSPTQIAISPPMIPLHTRKLTAFARSSFRKIVIG